MKTRRLAAGAMSIALAVTMFSTTAFAASVKFTDVPDSHWASSSITEMADKGIMSGIGNNLFAPSQQLSNAEFITMLVRQFYSDKLGTEGGTWYAPFMAARLERQHPDRYQRRLRREPGRLHHQPL